MINENTKLISPYEWVNVESRQYHLTINDIENLPLNKTINIFCMNNILDICCDENKNKKNIAIKPNIFFRYGYFITFTKTENGIKGKWRFNKEPNNSYKKEFDIDIDDTWKTLKNNMATNKLYSEFDKNTRVGWRGPMMLTQNIDKCGSIYWNDDNPINIP